MYRAVRAAKNGIFVILMPTGPCVRERGEYLKQKQMSAQRLDGHGWLRASCPDNCL